MADMSRLLEACLTIRSAISGLCLWLVKEIDGNVSATPMLPGQALVLAGPVAPQVTVFKGGTVCLESQCEAISLPYGRTDFNVISSGPNISCEDEAESITFEREDILVPVSRAVAVNRDQHCHGQE